MRKFFNDLSIRSKLSAQRQMPDRASRQALILVPSKSDPALASCWKHSRSNGPTQAVKTFKTPVRRQKSHIHFPRVTVP